MKSKIASLQGIKEFKSIYDKQVLTNSARSEFLNCRMKFRYAYVMGLVPRGIQVPFLVGGLFHDELERFYRSKKWDLKKTDKRIKEAIVDAIRENHVEKKESVLIESQRAMLMGILKGYKKQYKNDLKTWKIKAAEMKFKIPVKNGWSFSGMIDLLILKGKQVFIVEHKTTSQLNEGYVSRLPLDNQIIGYSWATYKTLKKMPSGVIYNVVLKSRFRLGQAEKFENYLQRVEEDYILNPTKYYYRESLLFSKKDLQKFQIELHKFIDEIERCDEVNFYYKNPTACTMYGRCLYMNLCIEGVNKTSLLRYSMKSSLNPELEKN